MSSDGSFVQFLVDQLADAGAITQKSMFGGHCIYCDQRVVALVCDDQLFVKPTEGGRHFIGDVVEGFAYEGAKALFLIEEQLEDPEWLSELAGTGAAN
jgi:TfoX/Sxy family transcriptional regulator of competence genes